MSDNTFYVYEHWRPDKGVCFYVGKGKGRRAWNMRWRNPHHRAIQSKLTSLGFAIDVRVIVADLSEEAAFLVERDRIQFWGRDNLANLTDGGEGIFNPSPEVREKIGKSKIGNTNMVGRRHSPETKAKLSAAHKGKEPNWPLINRLAEINKGSRHMIGRKASAETKAKMSSAHTGNQYALGYRHDDESKKRMSDSRKGRIQPRDAVEKTASYSRKPVLCLTDGRTFPSAMAAGKFYGLFNHAKVAEVCRGVRKTAAKRTFQYIAKKA